MSNEKKGCDCQPSKKLIFSCSGAADVGELADKAARKMTRDGYGRMYCLAGIGGAVGAIVDTTKAADAVLAVDGCAVGCTKKLLERAGLTGFEYMELTQMGFVKGKTEVSDVTVENVVKSGAKMLPD